MFPNGRLVTRALACVAVTLAFLAAEQAGRCEETRDNRRPSPLFGRVEFGPGDQKIAAEIERKVGEEPKGKDAERGAILAEEAAEKTVSPSFKARLLIFASDCNLAVGQRQRAKEMLARAFQLYGDTGQGLFAANKYLDLLQHDGESDDAAKFAAMVLDGDLDRNHRFHFLGRLALHLAGAGKTEESFQALKDLAVGYPEREKEVGRQFELVGSTRLASGDADAYYRIMNWASAHLPTYSKSAQFLSNYAHSSQITSHGKEAVDAMTTFVEMYPNDPRCPSFLLMIGNELTKMGEVDAAEKFYKKLLNLKADDKDIQKLKEAARANLSSSAIARESP